jgi:hypothetical protein
MAAIRPQRVLHYPLQIIDGAPHLSGLSIKQGDALVFDQPYSNINSAQLLEAAGRYATLSRNSCRPQLAAILYDLTQIPEALNHYFPLRRVMAPQDRRAFDHLIGSIRNHPNFDFQLVNEDGPMDGGLIPPFIPAIIAGHLAEIYYYRQDILWFIFRSRRRFRIFCSPQDYTVYGGVAGGCYHIQKKSLLMVLSRLFEGFFQEMPGVCPFIHEFGHMLDFETRSKPSIKPFSDGLMPGLRASDGKIFMPRALVLYRLGKQVEMDRYNNIRNGSHQPGQQVPFAHPYLFTSNSEFVAGMLELFFRCPNDLAVGNPQLYEAYSRLFGWDPRKAWPKDFEFYPRENRKAYENGLDLPPSRLTNTQGWINRLLDIFF